MSSQLVWIITGTAAGLGRELALAALKRGDKVIATARSHSLGKLDDLKAAGADVLELDVTASLDALKQAAQKAIAFHGRVDVVVNNAGFIEVGALEESTPEESLACFNTNVFGALNVARAFLPHMRERKSGTIAWLGSIGGWKPVPAAGLYAAAKYATRSLSETLHEEISPLGLRSVVFEFGYFRTSFLEAGHRAEFKPRIDDYLPTTQGYNTLLEQYNGKQPGDPKKGVQVMVDVIKGEGAAAGKPFPTVLALGSDCYDTVKGRSEQTLRNLELWADVTKSTDF